mgnify:CR=1 FL=1
MSWIGRSSSISCPRCCSACTGASCSSVAKASTSPLFILPIVAMLGEHVSKRAVFGAMISIVGIAMLYYAYGRGAAGTPTQRA